MSGCMVAREVLAASGNRDDAIDPRDSGGDVLGQAGAMLEESRRMGGVVDEVCLRLSLDLEESDQVVGK
jgi:hypothetical protein